MAVVNNVEAYNKSRQDSIVELLNVSDMAINRTYLPECINYQVSSLLPEDNNQRQKFNSCTKVFRVKRFVYNPEESITEKLKTFFLSLYHLPLDPSVFIIIKNTLSRGSKEAARLGLGDYTPGDFSLYLGLRTESVDKSVELKKMLKDSFCGTFLGSDLVEVRVEFDAAKSDSNEAGDGQQDSKRNRDKVLTLTKEIDNLVCVSAIPSVKKDTDNTSAEIGLEQFIDSMRDKEYTAVLIATPVASDVIQKRKRELENLYTRLSISRKQTFQFGENESKSVSKGISDTTGVSTTEGRSFSETNSHGGSRSRGGGESHSYSTSSESSGHSDSYNVSWSESESWTVSKTHGTSQSQGTSSSHSLSLNEGTSTGSSKTISIECENKNVVDMMTKINDTLRHITESEAYGLWECAAYFTADTLFNSMFAANNYRALVLGDTSSTSNCYLTRWEVSSTPGNNRLLNAREREAFEREQEENQKYINTLFDYVKRGIHPVLTHPEGGYYSNEELFSSITPTHAVSGRDLPYFLSLPLKSVPGVVVDSIAAFERSIYTKIDADKKQKTGASIRLGEIVHMGVKERDSEVRLSLKKLTGHTFIAGSTGSGKSNTMSVILDGLIEKNISFLVVEPAKGEYKKDFHKVENINIYTTNPLCERLLHLNPFRFDEDGIHVLEHVDRLLNIFGSCWELTAAMPAILKRAVEQAYESCGWDLSSSCFVGDGPSVFPTFSTVVQELHNVIENSGYSAEAKGNYTGALVTRVESLASGILRQIFCSPADISYEKLFDGRTIVDLSRLGSPDTKTLIMGVLVMLLSEYRMSQAQKTGKTNNDLQHVTVLEEAHNLLKNSNTASGGSAIIAKSVEMISNAIAEMRTYGEGFIIVDQSPTAVDISAIKNTNTKIVMRLPEQGDCIAMANAMGLNQFQQLEIAKQGQGKAIVMQNDWTAAVMVIIDEAKTSYSGTPEQIDREVYRDMRIMLALDIAEFGEMVLNKTVKSGIMTLSWDTAIDGKPVRDYWKELKASFDERCKEHQAGPLKGAELMELCEHHLKVLDNDGSKSVLEIAPNNLFAKLIIDILQCDNIWREYLAKNRLFLDDIQKKRPLTRKLMRLAPILNKYLSSPGIGNSQQLKKNTLWGLVRPYLYRQGVIACGGTIKDQSDFNQLRDQEIQMQNNSGATRGKA